MRLRARGLAGLAFTVTSQLVLPGADARPPKRPRWKTLTIQTSCEPMRPDMCRGSCGFTIASDGRYTTGPGFDGATATGTLTAAELATIAADADALARTSAKAKPTCDKPTGIPGTNTTLTLTPNTGKPVTLYQANLMGTGSNCTVGRRATTQRLVSAVAPLLAAYSPVPFPTLTPAPPRPTPTTSP